MKIVLRRHGIVSQIVAHFERPLAVRAHSLLSSSRRLSAAASLFCTLCFFQAPLQAQTILKSAELICDPINSGGQAFHIPGAIVQYTLTIIGEAEDNNPTTNEDNLLLNVTDQLSRDLELEPDLVEDCGTFDPIEPGNGGATGTPESAPGDTFKITVLNADDSVATETFHSTNPPEAGVTVTPPAAGAGELINLNFTLLQGPLSVEAGRVKGELHADEKVIIVFNVVVR